jgi:hypothetical protein
MNVLDLARFSWLSEGFNNEMIFLDSIGLRLSCNNC